MLANPLMRSHRAQPPLQRRRRHHGDRYWLPRLRWSHALSKWHAAGDGWKDFGIKPNFKGNVSWYLVAFLVYPITTACILIIGRGFGLIIFPNASITTLGLVFQTFALGLLPQFIKNIFEEGAWRGYLAPKVYSLRLNDFVGHIIVGLVWGAWHIPYYLFFLNAAVLQEFTTLNLTAFIPLSIVVMISWSMVYGEIRLLTKSFWPAVLMHAVEDALLIMLIADHHIQILPGTDWLVSPMNGLISVVFFIAIGVGLRQLRKRKMPFVETVRFIPVGSSRVEQLKQVECPTPYPPLLNDIKKSRAPHL